jgi:AcrR family transcriptional regulator
VVTNAEPASRARILDAALALMSEHGVSGTSMRQLAGESGLNVATLYHYFPSKADVLRAVIDERSLFDRMQLEPPVGRTGSPAERLEALLAWLWEESTKEEVVWRLLVGESLRGDPIARTTAATLVEGLDRAVAGWLAELVPELADPSVAARSVRVLLFALIVEHLALGPDGARVATRIDDLVSLLVP